MYQTQLLKDSQGQSGTDYDDYDDVASMCVLSGGNRDTLGSWKSEWNRMHRTSKLISSKNRLHLVMTFADSLRDEPYS